ncbi:MAG: SDR family NAD(P)-dependent oxidoreductase [Chthoniobacterales bacterium]
MKNTHAIIIGGTRGLGRVVAKLFANAGAKVSVLGAHEPDPADNGLQGVTFFQADIGNRAEAGRSLGEIVSRQGAVNYLVFAQRYRGAKENSWQGELDLMLTVPKNVLELLSGQFAKQGDRAVVFVSSPAGQFVVPEQDEAYHATRAALGGMTRWYAARWGGEGIRFNMVTPGAFVRELPGGKTFVPPAAADYARFVPLGRMAEATDVAQVVGFLCSEAAGFVNGQEIMVDGGASVLGQEALAMRFIKEAAEQPAVNKEK